MTPPDFNLLITLDALLSEGSVARAARRLHLSPSAMSRALARLRDTTGDPLLVRSGRGMVPTPRALQLRESVADLVQQVESALRPATAPDLYTLTRTFALRCSDGFVENFGPALLARLHAQAPGVRLRFVQKSDLNDSALQQGRVDLETGVVTIHTRPDLRTRALFRDHFVGVVRLGHALSQQDITPQRYAAGQHILVSRREQETGLVDDALQPLELSRQIACFVGGFATALALVRDSDLITAVPERHTRQLRVGLHTFALPLALPQITVSMQWHPRMDADPAHRWLRTVLAEVCGEADAD
ncbi:LysR family transcriptional regulator [Chitinibacter sp. GC72]|uniref:LysR family transcriptional regulator n=1 Tax=Chitinibacter sp. GC72 TaxID=1526917 RepID=UPI0012F920B6|nr:LysR family transcriptional regulator [Chitinibacter sp. GC72]